MRKTIAIVGDAVIEENGKKYRLAYETGKLLVENGYRVQSGGLQGVMRAAFCGAKHASNAQDGDTVAILPSFDRSMANPYADIVVATGLDLFRNIIVANADAVIAIGGGAGTLAEISSAWSLKRLVVAFEGVDGWSSKVAGTRMDHRVRYPDIPEDKVFAASTPEDALRVINKYVDRYACTYGGIKS